MDKLMSAKKLTWSDAIEKVMLKNNYFAALKKLNEEAPKLKGDFVGITPERTINERLQRDARFKKIMPGLWALTAYLDKLPKHVNPNVEKKAVKIVGAKKLTWATAIEEVMLKNNYFATLRKLNEEAPKLKGYFVGITPERTINEKLQRDERFTRVMPGLWALTAHLDKLPKHLNPDIEKNKNKKEEITHSLIQGYLIEIGNARGFDTFSPDKNGLFLDKKLKDIRTWDNCPRFTYEGVWKKIKHVDVIWFNERDYPARVIEVEHSTNFKNSLLKFVELQDFMTEMKIVAPKEKESQYERVISSSAFKVLKDRVQFVNYDDVTEIYSNSMDFVKLKSIGF